MQVKQQKFGSVAFVARVTHNFCVIKIVLENKQKYSRYVVT